MPIMMRGELTIQNQGPNGKADAVSDVPEGLGLQVTELSLEDLGPRVCVVEQK